MRNFGGLIKIVCRNANKTAVSHFTGTYLAKNIRNEKKASQAALLIPVLL